MISSISLPAPTDGSSLPLFNDPPKGFRKRKSSSVLPICTSAWTSEHSIRLVKEVADCGISPYPNYLSDSVKKTKTQWNKLPLYKEGFTTKTLRDRYLLRLSPKINHSPFTAEELTTIEKYLSYTDNNCYRWTMLSRILFNDPTNVDKLYRTENSLKNYYYNSVNKVTIPKKPRISDDPSCSPPLSFGEIDLDWSPVAES